MRLKIEDTLAAAPRTFRVTPNRSASARPRASGIGLILNARAHRNRVAPRDFAPASAFAMAARPNSRRELAQTLASFAAAGVETLVIDGGDGTVRDVLSAAPVHFPRGLPRMAVIPSGKTNALALDLGIPRGWTFEDALAASVRGRTRQRRPLDVVRRGEAAPCARGFLFGAGAFVQGTALAQGTHRMGAFGNLAVGLSVFGALAQTIFGSRTNAWRRGEAMALDFGDGRRRDGPLYLALASTLERFPLGLKPFGRERAGLKFLSIDAPPRHIVATLPMLLAGRGGDRLDRRGVLRRDPATIRIAPSRFVLDGETFAGGPLEIRPGAPVDFVVP